MDLKSKLVDIEVHTGPTELLEYTICNETDEKRFSNGDKKRYSISNKTEIHLLKLRTLWEFAEYTYSNKEDKTFEGRSKFTKSFTVMTTKSV